VKPDPKNFQELKTLGKKCDRGRLLVLNNSVTFSGKTIGSEDFLNQMVEALRKINHRKNRMCLLNYKIIERY